MYLKDNLKIIRDLWRLNQSEFASLFTGINENQQKSYERKKPSEPGLLYLAELSKMTGVPQETLINNKLSVDQIAAEPLWKKGEEGKVKMVNQSTTTSTFDSKEGILRLLDKALDENALHAEANRSNAISNERHAGANEKNAAAHEKNATAMLELVRLLGIKFNSTGTALVSQTSLEEEKPGPAPQEPKPSGTPENRLIPSLKKRKGKVVEKDNANS